MPDTAVVETNPTATPTPELKAAFASAKAAMNTPASEAKPEVKTEPATEVPQFFQKPAPKEETAPSLDAWKSMSEEERYKGWLRQQDYTKKTTEHAENVRTFEAQMTARREEFDRYAKLLMERTTPSRTDDPNVPVNPMDKVQQLRDEGNYAEADRLLVETVKSLAQQEVEPIKKAAETERLQATFQNVTAQAMEQPLVKHFAKEVAQVFDSNAPVVQEFRQFALSSPERMQRMIPAFTYLLATEQYAKTLETTFNERLESGIKKGIEERRSAANRVPGKVVESAGASRETATGLMSLKDSMKFAFENGSS